MSELKIKLAASCALLFGVAVAFAEGEPKLLDELKKSPEFLKAIEGKKKLVFCDRRTLSPTTRGESLVEATFFNYNNGRTIRATFDNKDKKVVKIEALEAYPTPLAAEELRRAEELAKQKAPKVAELFKLHGDKVENTYLSPVVSDRENPRFGKRIVVLHFRHKDDANVGTVSVTVNLTDETVAAN